MDVKQQKDLCALHDQLGLHEITKKNVNSTTGFCAGCKTLLIRDWDKDVWKNAFNTRKDLDKLVHSFSELYELLTAEDKADLKLRMLGNPHAAKLFNREIGGDDQLFEAMSNSTGAVTDFLKRCSNDITAAQHQSIKAAALRSPRTAFYYAVRLKAASDGPLIDQLRVVASKSATYALKFALQVDASLPHAVTKAGVLKDAKQAGKYASWILKTPDDQLRTACCAEAYWAYYYAQHIDKCGKDETRIAACKFPKYAYVYARWVDKASRDDTKAAAAVDPHWALEYLKGIVKRYDAVLVSAIPTTAMPYYSQLVEYMRFKGISMQR